MSDTAVASEVEAVAAQIEANTPRSLYVGKRVLALTPDSTRTCPLPVAVRAVAEVIGAEAARLDFMVALGTHPVMTDAAVRRLYGINGHDERFATTRLLNHRWDRSDTLQMIGTLSERETAELTEGRFREALEVTINRHVFDYDLVLIVGPVFPHEIVGFSGGNKYLFPGISGGEFLDMFHWLSAVITCMETIGRKWTPARAVVDRAARMLTVPTHLVAMVVKSETELHDLFVGPTAEAWERAADLSAQKHITYTPRRYHTVFGHAPEMYDEMWVAGKVMYKLEPVIADGGTLIIYGPHITELSATWGTYLREVGYHTAAFLQANMERYSGVPRGVLAHSALVKGVGSFADGVESPRTEVVLATALPEDLCRQVNLGYSDPATLDPADFRGRESEGILYVAHAGEILHRPATGVDTNAASA